MNKANTSENVKGVRKILRAFKTKKNWKKSNKHLCTI